MYIDGYLVVVLGILIVAGVLFTYWAMNYIEHLEADVKELQEQLTKSEA